MLQHGSILMASSTGAPELPGVNDLGSQAVTVADLSGEITSRLGDRLGVQWDQGELQAEELESASLIRTRRFADPSWLTRR